jgi:hypothetical protein
MKKLVRFWTTNNGDGGCSATVEFECSNTEEALAVLGELGFVKRPTVVTLPPAAPTVPPPPKANRVEPEPTPPPAVAAPAPVAPAPAAEAPVRRGPGRPPKNPAPVAPVAPAPQPKPAPAPTPVEESDDLDSLDEPEPEPVAVRSGEDDKIVADAANLGKIRDVVELIIKRKGFTKSEQIADWVAKYGARIEAVARLGDKGVERARTAADLMLPDEE